MTINNLKDNYFSTNEYIFFVDSSLNIFTSIKNQENVTNLFFMYRITYS